MPEFVRPTSDLQDSFLAAAAEFAEEGARDSQTAEWIEQFGLEWEDPARFADFVAWLRADELEETPRAGTRVPSTTLWWVDTGEDDSGEDDSGEDDSGEDDSGEYIGRLAIRHRLNEKLLELGGHIGYDVRPSRRREGHGTAMLKASLPLARQLGIESALVTCNVDNVASIRVIESAGGVLEDQRGRKLRFWVPTG